MYALNQIRTYSAEIPWEVQRDAYSEPEALVEKVIVVLNRPMLVLRCDIWIGLFGGVPSAVVYHSADDYAFAVTHGQVQEVTVDVYAKIDGHPRIRLWGRDLHQLTPSASFAGWQGENLPAIVLPEGADIWMVTRTSQRDRGAHTRATIMLAEVPDDPA